MRLSIMISSSILSALVFFTVIPFVSADNEISSQSTSSSTSSSRMMLRADAAKRTTYSKQVQHRILQVNTIDNTNTDEREKIGRPIGSLGRDPTVVSSFSAASMSIDAILSGNNNNNNNGNADNSTTGKTVTYVASAVGAIIALVLVIGLGLFIGRRRKNATRKHKQNPLAEQNSNDAIDTSDDDDNDDNDHERRRNEYEDNVEVSDSSYDGRYGACSRYSSHTDDTSTIATKIHVTTKTKETASTKGTVVPATDNNVKEETQDSSWFGWVLGSTGKIEEDKPSGNNVTYGEI